MTRRPKKFFCGIGDDVGEVVAMPLIWQGLCVLVMMLNYT